MFEHFRVTQTQRWPAASDAGRLPVSHAVPCACIRLVGTDAMGGVAFGAAGRRGTWAGEVVVGKIGDDLRMDYSAQGHVVGLAARMEQIAEPGKCTLRSTPPAS